MGKWSGSMFPICNEVPKQTFLFYVEDCLQGRAASASEGVESSGLREPGLWKAITISEKRGFFVINVGHIGDCLVAEACLSVPLEAQLSPLGGFDSSLSFVPSHWSFFFFGKSLPPGAVLKLWESWQECWTWILMRIIFWNILMFSYVGGNGSPLDREQNGTIRDLTLVPREIALNGGQQEKQTLVKRSSEGGRGSQDKKW